MVFTRDSVRAAILAASFACACCAAYAESLPAIALFTMEDIEGGKLLDASPSKLHATLEGAVVVRDSERGNVLVCDGVKQRAVFYGKALEKKSFSALTVAAWVKVERAPPGTGHGNVWNPNPEGFFIWRHGKLARYAPPCFQVRLGVHADGRLRTHIGWSFVHWKTTGKDAGEKVAPGAWHHVALTYRAGGELRGYIDGKLVVRRPSRYTAWYSDKPFVLGGADCKVALDDVAVYAAELTRQQIADIGKGDGLATRAFTEKDAAPDVYGIELWLTRFDMPGGRHSFRQNVTRRDGPDAVDWPRVWLPGGRELFANGPEERFEVPRKFTKLYFRDTGGESSDQTLEPYGLWFRAQPWNWDQHNIFSTEPTLHTQHGHELELWTFPLRVEAADRVIRSARVRLGGKTVYEKAWGDADGLRSLTLQLPQNVGGRSYELVVNDAAPVRFDVGLEDYVPGEPRDVAKKVDVCLQGDGPRIRVYTPERPGAFPNRGHWDKDLAAMKEHAAAGSAPKQSDVPVRRTMRSRLGIDAPRSPVTYQAVYMRHGMSHGFASGSHAGFKGSAAEYFDNVSSMRFDRIFEAVDRGRLESKGMEWWQVFLEKCLTAGIQVGFNPHELGDSSWPVFAYNLPQWHEAGYRDTQLLFQRFAGYPHIAGAVAGGESAGYKSFWMWAPPTPNRPWSRAMVHFHEHAPPRKVVTHEQRNQHYWAGWNLGKGTAREFYDYCEYYDRMYDQYAHLRTALEEVDPRLMLTLGAYGEGPGASSTGGWGSAGCIPGRPLFKEVNIVQAYDWNEMPASKALHNVALMDRLRGYYPDKPLWTIPDDFGVFFGKLPRERAYALSLTRGPAAIGTNALPHKTGPFEKDDRKHRAIGAYAELGDWVRKYGGAYSMMKPEATIAVYYSMEQGRCRVITGKEATSRKPEDLAKIRAKGSHEGKTTEALVMCTAAGWPAEVVTRESLRAGLSDSVKVLLLTGLNRFDDTWAWHDGLEGDLRRFVDRGGRILLDDESVCPVAATKTRVSVAPYVPQGAPDLIDLLVERNRDNIAELRRHMAGVAQPVVSSDAPTAWCIPSLAGDVRYVTVANYAWEAGKNASQFYTPATAKLSWRTDRPVYDVFAGRKLSASDAGVCDLTKRSFALYALPARDPVAPEVKTSRRVDGFFEAAVTMGDGMDGVPVRLDISRGDDAVTLHTATGLAAKLPVTMDDTPGTYRISATELLSGATSESTFAVVDRGPRPERRKAVDVRDARGLLAFAEREDVPLTVALTPRQSADTSTTAIAARIAEHYRGRGRTVDLGVVEPNGVVLGLRSGPSISRFPQWRTPDVDLVLLGTPRDNVLMFDQQRCRLLRGLDGGRPAVAITYSPFSAKRHCVNIVASGSEGLSTAVGVLLGLRPPPKPKPAVVEEKEGEDAVADRETPIAPAAARESVAESADESQIPMTLVVGIGIVVVLGVVVVARKSGSKRPRRRRTPRPNDGARKKGR